MFTGIIEETGTVESITRGRCSAVLSIRAQKVLEGTRIGDSIAVNGVCLTVTSLQKAGFTADVMHETLDRSALGSASCGSRVNLERALAVGGRLGGHIVSGHIDGTGTITNIRRDDTAVWYTISCGPDLMRGIVEKGSVAVNGISLTVAQVNAGSFAVSTIPHTNSRTTLPELQKGSVVNIETDIIGKYVERLMAPAAAPEKESGITPEFLARCGF